MLLVLENCAIFDGVSETIADGQAIVIEDGLIREVGDSDTTAALRSEAQRIDAGGRFVMPGMIDAHFHAYGIELNPVLVDRIAPELRGLHARRILEGALQRGFTTIRDAAGGDVSLATALRTGLIDGPRLFYPGLAISQTGGHGDLRAPDHYDACACAYCGAMAVVADGPDEMRKMVREQLRTGATHIKLFVSGGVLSPSDPIWMNQLSIEEIRIAVAEADTRRAYVMAHAHTNEAVLRCVGNGVRSIEHATLLEDSGAQAIAEADAFAVPTLAVIETIRASGASLGLPPAMIDKMREVADQANISYERLRAAGAKIGFGTDLLGKLMPQQSIEFRLRRETCRPIEILRSATSVNAALLRMEGRLGTIAPGAFADILIVEGNPLDDVTLLEKHENIRCILRDGRIVRNALG
ncbi:MULTISPECIES: metal-dependent hydrolase family protein [unclassified Sphingomonas]|uniref:metal-dependent hydrolase family protein n=1 Tax=unclassified Sphingomonas TaxID=196159 RepID=UPI0006FB0B71|nr:MULTISPECIES: amidohydrolase family protein [unclassified Sphingomonas]KQX19202.1 amidohydrolase [Sphingomonas sp. Root1294]KQY65404.1 amidohydrolase [Sphingomonas sp. Root50]KRB95299.1 amidohydrolase [Sphingomonas sp. Root720]